MLRESLPVGPCPQISPPGFICRVSVHLLLSGAGEGDQEDRCSGAARPASVGQSARRIRLHLPACFEPCSAHLPVVLGVLAVGDSALHLVGVRETHPHQCEMAWPASSTRSARLARCVLGKSGVRQFPVSTATCPPGHTEGSHHSASGARLAQNPELPTHVGALCGSWLGGSR